MLSKFAGEVAEIPPSVFVDLVDEPSPSTPSPSSLPSPWTFKRLITTLETTAERGEKLFQRAQTGGTTTPMHQVCELIVHTFSEILPMPKVPFEYRKEEEVWCVGELTLKRQR